MRGWISSLRVVFRNLTQSSSSPYCKMSTTATPTQTNAANTANKKPQPNNNKNTKGQSGGSGKSKKHWGYFEYFADKFGAPGNLKNEFVDTHVHIDAILYRLTTEGMRHNAKLAAKGCGCGGDEPAPAATAETGAASAAASTEAAPEASSETKTESTEASPMWTWPRLVQEHIRGPCAAVVTVSCEPATHREVLRLLNLAHPSEGSEAAAGEEAKTATTTTATASPESDTKLDATTHEGKVQLLKAYQQPIPAMWAAFGLHPHEAKHWNAEQEAEIREALKHPRAVALGECGLDYYYMNSPKEVQQQALIQQLQIALEIKKPIVIHARDADDDIFEILKAHVPKDWKLHFHCNTSPAAQVKRVTEYFPNAYFGYTGVITYPTAEEVRGAVAATPFNRLLLETDGPFMAPLPFRGRTATSGHIPFTAEVMAQIHNVSLEELLAQVRANTREFYGI